MSDDDQKTSSPTVIYSAGQRDAAETTDLQVGSDKVKLEPPQTGAARPSGVISLDDPDLKLIDPDVLDSLPDSEFFPRVNEWLDALHDSFDYDTTLVPQNKLKEVPLLGTTAKNLETTDRHFAVDNDTNTVNPAQLYFAEATLMVLALTKAIAKRTAHRPDLDAFRGKFANADEKEWLQEIAEGIFEDGYIDENKFDNNEATLEIKNTIWEAKETAEKVAPYLVGVSNDTVESSDERDIDVERVAALLDEETQRAKEDAGNSEVESQDVDAQEFSPLTEEEQQREQELASRLPSFTDLIDPEIPAVVAYLEAAFRATGTQAPDKASLETFARAQLSALDADILLGIAAGIPLYREKMFSTMSKSLLEQYRKDPAHEGSLVQEIALDGLRGIIALRLSDGLSPDEILAELEVLSAQELGLLLGIEISAGNESSLRANIRERATQLLISVFSAAPMGKKVVALRQRTAVTYSSAAPEIKAKNEEIEKNINSAAEGSKTTGEKVQSFLKAYQKSWTSLTQDEQLMVYFLADLPIGDRMFDSNKPIDIRLPLPFQFVNFAYSTYGKSFQDLVKRFQLDPKEFKRIYKDHRLKYELISAWTTKKSATNTVEYLTSYKQQEAQISLDVYQSLNAREKLKIAKAAGFASVAAYETILVTQVSQPPVFAQDNIVVARQEMGTPGRTEIVFEFVPNPMANEEIVAAILAAEHGAELKEFYEQLDVLDEGYKANIFDGPTTPRRGSLRGTRETGGGRLKQIAKERAGQAFKQARQKVVKKAGQKLSQQAIKQGVRAAGKAAAGATAGLSMVAAEVATNKNLRRLAYSATTAGVGYLVNAAGSLWGMMGGIIGGAFGMLGGPLGVFGGGVGGILAGNAFGESLGWNPRLFGARQYPIGQAPMEPSMAQIQSQVGGGNSFSSAAPQQLARGGASSSSLASSSAPVASASAPGGSAATAASTTAATVSAASTAIASWISGAIFPVVAMGGIFVVTMFTLTVIWGAFLVPTPEEAGEIPDRPGGPNPPGIPVNPYITVRKFATPTTLPNNTPATVNYTIQVESKSGYVVKVNSFTDTFSSMGDQVPPNLTSPLAGTEFGDEKITSGKEVTYTMQLSGVDALITNSATVLFDVYPVGADTPIRTNQKAMARASVTIGTPKLACWPASGQLTQLEGGSFSHVGFDAIDIVAMPGLDWNVYAPIAGEACPIEQNKRLDPITGAWIYSGYGRYIKMQGEFQGKQVTLIFGHFSTYLSGLEPGSCQFVQPGTPLGIMDSTGFSTADHLHYELRPGSGLKLRDLIAGSENIRVGDNVTTCFSP